MTTKIKLSLLAASAIALVATQAGAQVVGTLTAGPTTNTANGNSVGYMVRLKSIQIGGVHAENVAAMIAPGLDGDVLLGMSFLGRMDVRLYKGEMTIKQVHE